jgi:hypothetical protein
MRPKIDVMERERKNLEFEGYLNKALALGRSNDCKINIESNDYSLYLPWAVMVPLLNLE